MNTVSIGDIGESFAIAKFTRKNFIVSKPLSNNARYDLIVEINGKLYKVQVKSTNSIKNGKMSFATKTTNYNKGSWASIAYSPEEIDLFFLYCLSNNWCGLYFPDKSSNVPVELNLRVDLPRNGQKTGIKFAKDFEFEKQIATLKST